MNNLERRQKIIEILSKSAQPVNGAALSEKFDVSRQIIVADIASLRLDGHPVISTNRGYVLDNPLLHIGTCRRAISVCHDDAMMETELSTIVDYGGSILNVVVFHDVYGQITADLSIRNRVDVSEFMEKIKNSKSGPLKNLTDGRHVHVVEANSEALLDIIEEKLREQGILIE